MSKKGFVINGLAAIIGSAIAIGSIVFAFGGRLATIESNVRNQAIETTESRQESKEALKIANGFQAEIKAINNKLDMITDYFKLVPKNQSAKDGTK